MSEYEKFLPEDIPNSQLPFWDSLREHNVKVQRCDNCATYRYAPKELCANCQTSAATWTPIDGRGEIYTFTIVRRAPTPAYQAETPYVIAHVTMNEGFRMIGRLDGLACEDVSIGLPVRVTYDDATPQWTILHFEPA